MTRFLINVGGFCVGFGGTGCLIAWHSPNLHSAYDFPILLTGILFMVVGLTFAVLDHKRETPTE